MRFLEQTLACARSLFRVLSLAAFGAALAHAGIVDYSVFDSGSFINNVGTIIGMIHTVVTNFQAQGAHVSEVDLNTQFPVNNGISSDGLHPNDTGYKAMADSIDLKMLTTQP